MKIISLILVFITIKCANSSFSFDKNCNDKILHSFSINNDSLDFRKFVSMFEDIQIPLDSIDLINLSKNKNADSISPKIVNFFIAEKFEHPAYFINLKREKERCEFYGRYPEKFQTINSIEKVNGKYIDVKKILKAKLIAIGKIDISENFETFIIKSDYHEGTTYDLWSFTKEGEVLSEVSLYWKKKMGREFVAHNSTISEDGKIHWTFHTFSYQDNSMMYLYRTYILNKNGYFQVIEERKSIENK